MSVVAITAIVGTGLAVAGKAYAGHQAGQVDTQGAMDAAGEMSLAERAHLGEEIGHKRDILDRKQENLLEMAQSKSASKYFDIFKSKQSAASQTGFAGNQEIDATSKRVEAGIYKDYGQTVDRIVDETKAQKQSMNLGKQKELAGIEKRLQSTIDSVLQTPDSFMEGFFGASDYQVG